MDTEENSLFCRIFPGIALFFIIVAIVACISERVAGILVVICWIGTIMELIRMSRKKKNEK